MLIVYAVLVKNNMFLKVFIHRSSKEKTNRYDNQ